MQPSTFEERVRQHVQALTLKDEDAVDWNERKDWWQRRVSALLESVERWITPLVKSNTVSFSRESVSINEEMLGLYTAETGTIKLGKEKLHFQPVGSVILGGFGRVDVDGPNGTVMLILLSLAPNEHQRDLSEWYIVHPKSRREFIPLTQDSFEQLFADLFGIDG